MANPHLLMRLGSKPIRQLLIGASLLCGMITSALAQLSVGIALPGASIGIDLSVYPQLLRVPGYPVYYAPQMASNYFFYDGVYWVYQGDHWYASRWYNGPWYPVGPMHVPHYVLRIPVGYYRAPPAYFRGAPAHAPPPWDRHWGSEWQQQRKGWNQWNPRQAPAPAPLPLYQRQYSGKRYPSQAERQQSLSNQHYRYQPREPAARLQQAALGADKWAEGSEPGAKSGKDREPHGKQP
jgi:hypothetical protein